MELTKQKNRLQTSIKAVEKQLAKKLSPERKIPLYDKRTSLEEELDNVDIERNEALADARISYVTKRLQCEKQKHIPAGSMPAFRTPSMLRTRFQAPSVR